MNVFDSAMNITNARQRWTIILSVDHLVANRIMAARLFNIPSRFLPLLLVTYGLRRESAVVRVFWLDTLEGCADF